MCECCKARIEQLEAAIGVLSEAVSTLDYRTMSDGDKEYGTYIETPIISEISDPPEDR